MCVSEAVAESGYEDFPRVQPMLPRVIQVMRGQELILLKTSMVITDILLHHDAVAPSFFFLKPHYNIRQVNNEW